MEIGGALVEVTSRTNRIVGEASRRPGPRPGTTACGWASGETWSTGFSSIMQAISTATDHSRAFARLLRANEPHGPSLASLCRAFAETAGRAWWLLESTDAAQLAHRAATMRHQEVRDVGTTGTTVRVREGKYEIVSHEEALREADRALSEASVPGRREKTPNYTALATAVMAVGEITEPASKYSHLSAVAHGAGFSVGGLGTRAPHVAEGFTHFTIALPIANAQLYCKVITRVLDVVMTRFVELACDDSERERWKTSYVRSHNRIVTVFDKLEGRDVP